MLTPLVALIIQEALQYGPEFVMQIITILKKPDATIQDVEVLFTGVKPYSAYNIPDKITPPAIPTATPQ
jgi:hypothetical protein